MLEKSDIEIWLKNLQNATEREFKSLSRSLAPKHNRELESLAASEFNRVDSYTKYATDDSNCIQEAGSASKIITNLPTHKL